MDTAKSAAVAVPPVATEDTAPPPPAATSGVPPPPAATTIVGPPMKTIYEKIQEKLTVVLRECLSFSDGKSKSWASAGFIQMGDASTIPTELAAVLSFNLGPHYDVAWVTYRTKDNKHGSCVLKKIEVEGVKSQLFTENDAWTVCLDHRV